MSSAAVDSHEPTEVEEVASLEATFGKPGDVDVSCCEKEVAEETSDPTSLIANSSPQFTDDDTMSVARDISYRPESSLHKHQLDIYFPKGVRYSCNAVFPSPSLPSDISPTAAPIPAYPVYFHVHGGGWARGDRRTWFYGAPGVCLNMSRFHGCLSVAPSYRLGAFEHCIEDVASALKWVIANIQRFGGNPRHIICSGHSAGAHLMSMVMLQGDVYGVSAEEMACIKSVVLISGVYSLQAPLGHQNFALRNVIFRRRYVRLAFGEDPVAIDESAPSCLLLSWGVKSTEPVATDCFISSFINKFRTTSGDSDSPPFPTSTGSVPLSSETSGEHHKRLESLQRRATPVLVLNASFDLGLEIDGKMFHQLLQAALASSTQSPLVQWTQVPGTNHASICWTSETTDVIANFLEEHNALV